MALFKNLALHQILNFIISSLFEGVVTLKLCVLQYYDYNSITSIHKNVFVFFLYFLHLSQ